MIQQIPRCVDWHDKLPRLSGYPLISYGAGEKGKAPLDSENDRHLSGSQTTESAQFKAQSESIQPVESYDEEQIEELIRRSQL